MSDLMRLARSVANRQTTAQTEATRSEKPSTTATLPADACATCAHFRVAPGAAQDGWCRKCRVDAWGQYADGCADGWIPLDPAARRIERECVGIVARLKADPTMRYAFDVANAPPRGPASTDVRVLLGLRDATGRIITGELRVPADRWPGIAIFAEYWRIAAEGTPS